MPPETSIDEFDDRARKFDNTARAFGRRLSSSSASSRNEGEPAGRNGAARRSVTTGPVADENVPAIPPASQDPAFDETLEHCPTFTFSEPQKTLRLLGSELKIWHLDVFAVNPADQRFEQMIGCVIHDGSCAGSRMTRRQSRGNCPLVQYVGAQSPLCVSIFQDADDVEPIVECARERASLEECEQGRGPRGDHFRGGRRADPVEQMLLIVPLERIDPSQDQGANSFRRRQQQARLTLPGDNGLPEVGANRIDHRATRLVRTDQEHVRMCATNQLGIVVRRRSGGVSVLENDHRAATVPWPGGMLNCPLVQYRVFRGRVRS